MVASTDASVPPKGMTHERPAAGAEVNGAVVKTPVPMHVLVAPAAPMVLKTISISSRQATLDILIGTVTVCEVPMVVPPMAPYWGINISVPDAPVDKMPPALMQ